MHAGALGWNGFMAAGMFYWMVPRLYGRDLWSKKLADTHFWIGTFGILLYVVSMWVSGITQGLMWRATDAQGALVYPNFVETLDAIRPMYWMRLIGGSMYLVGMVMMAYNLARTALAGQGRRRRGDRGRRAVAEREVPWAEILFGKPVVVVTMVAVIAASMAVVNNEASIVLASILVVVAILGTMALHLAVDRSRPRWHRLLEGRALLFASFTIIAVLAGGIAELVPTLLVTPSDPHVLAEAKPYRALELEGRDLYVREGCYTCHSQMIRPFRSRRSGTAIPRRWPSRSTTTPSSGARSAPGPDLAREGGKYPNLWHYRHLIDARSVSPGSNMPPFPRWPPTRSTSTRTAHEDARPADPSAFPTTPRRSSGGRGRRGGAGRGDRQEPA